MNLLSAFKKRPKEISDIGFKQESPNVAILREEAKRKMRSWGRKSLLEGGEFSRNNKVLVNINNFIRG